MMIIIAIAFIAVSGLVYVAWQYHRFLDQINTSCQMAIAERQLDPVFTDKPKKAAAILARLNKVFALLRSLDHLKSARVHLEVKTVTQLTRDSTTGVILVRPDHIVTYINTAAETYLRLIPGETLGETLHYTDLTTLLNKALLTGEKALDNELEIAQKPLLASVFPIDDKFGKIARVIIMVQLDYNKDNDTAI